ncbi:hypothetical protein [Streptomyces sp. AK04-3B]|uniref:hypothetical protein n=1 Tax=Streptomyces sp. AK04-3B TaxID=3028650 RepID=UPI0029C0351B|nr:hypothetical protein [Streptomyces sp. AK04-3B]
MEGAGEWEVQTPVLGAAAHGLRPGEHVWFRHAKAGEPCERVDTLHLVSDGEIVEEVTTYRGEGHAFLCSRARFGPLPAPVPCPLRFLWSSRAVGSSGLPEPHRRGRAAGGGRGHPGGNAQATAQ